MNLPGVLQDVFAVRPFFACREKCKKRIEGGEMKESLQCNLVKMNYLNLDVAKNKL